ncbi:MAG: flippase-like domain-containing protein [Acidobacteriota bacterium]|nr:flippase-like domain-containing protein [Acidobacteriota bacterium]MDH3785308.1 flippase-like domain-containing protein [Acidobacteriota bacterium]
MPRTLVKRALRYSLIVVGVGVMAWTLHSLGPRQVLDIALQADPFWLLLSGVAVFGRFLIWGIKWSLMLRRKEPVPYSLSLRILAAGSFVNLTTPTAKLAGGVLRAALLRRRRKWGWASAYGWALADQVTNVLGNTLFAAVLVIALAPSLPTGGVLLATIGVAAIGLLIFIGWARGWVWERIGRPAIHDRLVAWIPARLRSKDSDRHTDGLIRELFRPLLFEGGPWRSYVIDLLWAAAAFTSLCLANALVFRALGIEAPLLALAAAVCLGYVVGVVIGVWGGIGVTEAALTAFYVQIGVDEGAAAAAALLHRALFYTVVCGWGGYSLLREGRPSVVEELADEKGSNDPSHPG